MTALATHDHVPGDLAGSLAFLVRTRSELRSLRKVHLHRDRLEVFDVNRDSFLLRGIGYPDTEVLPLLRQVNAAYDPETIHQPVTVEYKELGCGRRHTWAEDRVM